MQVLVIVSVLCIASCSAAPQYVWDLLKPALTSDEVLTIINSKDNSYPTLADVPETKFDCSKMKQPGFYADVDTKCQVFHRCDQAGIRTSYLCVNSTVFNQITLICDAWFNVECERSGEFVDFANSRLYTDKPLFDTPPADYVSPGQIKQQQAQKALLDSLSRGGQISYTVKVSKTTSTSSSKKVAAAKPAAAIVTTTTTEAPAAEDAAPADSGASASGDASAASSSSDSSSSGDASAATEAPATEAETEAPAAAPVADAGESAPDASAAPSSDSSSAGDASAATNAPAAEAETEAPAAAPVADAGESAPDASAAPSSDSSSAGDASAATDAPAAEAETEAPASEK